MKVWHWGITKSRAGMSAVRLATVVSLISTSTAAILLGSTGVAQATPTVVCTWTNASGTPDISIADNWSPNAGQSCGGTSTSTGTATLSGAQLVFPATIPTGGGSPSLDQSESVDDVVFDNGYTIGAGGGTLTLTPSGGYGLTDNANSVVQSPVALGNSQVWQAYGGGDLAVTGVISGGFSLTAGTPGTGTGIVNLSAVNTFTGSTTAQAGTLQVGGGSLSSGAVSISDGATLEFETPSATTFSNTLTMGSSHGGATMENGSPFLVTWSGNVSLIGGISNTINGLDGGLSITGAISGTALLDAAPLKSESGVANSLSLSGANSYAGGTTVSSGTLVLGAANSVPGALNVDSGAAFDLAGYADSVTSISGAGTITDSGAAATLTDTQTTSTTFSGNITGAVALNMDGSGGELYILGGSADSYTGGTTVTAGELMDGAPADGFGTGAITVDDNATLGIGGGIGGTFPNALTLGSSAGGATLSNTFDSTWNGSVTLVGTSDTLGTANPLTVSGVI